MRRVFQILGVAAVLAAIGGKAAAYGHFVEVIDQRVIPARAQDPLGHPIIAQVAVDMRLAIIF